MMAALGHRFERIDLLQTALTHRSYANEHPEECTSDNERLEFLGDAVLGWVIASLLWEHFPSASEGELTRRRADLVSERGLSLVAAEIHLPEVLRLGRGERKSGGKHKPRLIASALEACLGAVYLDGGPDAALKVGRALWGPRLNLRAGGRRDFKSRLQELLQARSATTPRYRLLRSEGPDHARMFFVGVEVGDEVVAKASGRSKIDAEQAAAKIAWDRFVATEGEHTDTEPTHE